MTIAAPKARVWRALTDPDEVHGWDGAVPYDVPPAYPSPGQHARWRVRVLRVPVTLHDHIQAVEPERRLASRLSIGPFSAEEEYVLDGESEVTLTMSGSRLLTRGAAAALLRLRRWCEEGPQQTNQQTK